MFYAVKSIKERGEMARKKKNSSIKLQTAEHNMSQAIFVYSC